MKTITTAIFVLFSAQLLCAQSLSAVVVEKGNGNPIPYAAIKIDEYNGVITNEEGVFTIINPNVKTIIISCLGFKELEISVEDIKKANFRIELENAVNQLNEILLTNKFPSIDSIIYNIRNNFKNNHDLTNTSLELFSRSTNYFDFDNFELDLNKAQALPKKSLADLKSQINVLTTNVVKSQSKSFNDLSGTLYIADSLKTKLVPKQSTRLLDVKNDYSLDKLQDQSQTLFLKALDTNLTYKVRTGIFRVEDSLSFNETKHKKDEQIDSIIGLKWRFKPLLSTIENFENTIIGGVLDTKLYDFSIRDVVYTDGSMAYVIDFLPRKGKAKFAGTFIVMANSYAIKRFDYSYAEGKRGSKLNLKLLVGVKFIEEVEEGSIHFERDINNLYKPFYIKKNTVKYVYLSRPFVFVENTKAKNKFGFDLLIEGRVVEKDELLITNSNGISLADYNVIEEPKRFPYKRLSQYTPSIWENQQVLEPVEEMKTFVVKD